MMTPMPPAVQHTSDTDWEDITPPAPKPPPRRPHIFPAAYRGKCTACGFDIAKDDPIGYLDDQIACELCIYENLGERS